MAVVRFQELGKSFGDLDVFTGLTGEVPRGARIGLVGANGVGKTTLMRIFVGFDTPTAGTLHIAKGTRVGILEQEAADAFLAPQHTVFEEMLTVFTELRARESALRRMEIAMADGGGDEALLARYGRAQEAFARDGGYEYELRIEQVLAGLGFQDEQQHMPLAHCSGGQKTRALLARLLLEAPDLLVLDEPTNHLDIEAVAWLESTLARWEGALVIVSHDRYFLDKVTNGTLELFRGTVDRYPGNFSAYLRQKDERLLVQRRAYEKQQIEIEKAKEFIRRNAYGQKHAQAEDRRKKLERIEPVEPPRQIESPIMGFASPARSGDVVLRAEHLGKAYQRPLFDELSFEVARGQRWAILGPNGSGKTTLLRCLLGQVAPDAGRAVLGHGVRIGYFDQHLSSLDDECLVVDAIRPDHKEFDEQKRRDLLARFGLTGDMAFQKVGSLSGGERCRAALARLHAADANLLVLDEPTNHLDLWAREALQRSLCDFEGTVLFVSHDRYFIDRVADHLLVIQEGRVRVVEGNYGTYRHLVERGLAGHSPPADEDKQPAKAARPATAPERQPQPVRAKRRFPYRKLDDLEREIFERETRIEALHAGLAEPEVLRDGDRVRQLRAELAEHQSLLKTLYEHWEEAAELNW